MSQKPKTTIIDLVDFWGKAQPLNPDQVPVWHPLAFHSLDVAAVGTALLTSDKGLCEQISNLAGLDAANSIPLLSYLLCLHDIGKFAKKFQAKVPDRYPACFGDDPAGLSTGYDHGNGGLRLFDARPEAFRLPSGTDSDAWRPLICAVTGHHGSPPEGGRGMTLVSLRPDFGKVGIDAAHEFLRCAHELLAVPSDMAPLDQKRARRASHALAGLAVLADWIGSKQEWFPYREPVCALSDYWRDAQEQACRAVTEAGVLPAAVATHLVYDDLISTTGTTPATPSPMQHWAATVELPDMPALFLIEDETGSGKTEAALMLTHRLMKARHASGFYVALPTMATANAMFDRLGAAHRRLFSDDAEPSIALAHGARAMHDGFRAVKLAGRREKTYSGTNAADDMSETTASAACAEWIADDRRRSFLAHAGTGTIDQALLSVLPVRHQSLRLFGLMRRVLILDEVHAYDAYMQREMERLIEFQARLGGSAILLSATLPWSIRRRFADAFAGGLGMEVSDADSDIEYPLVTVCSRAGKSSTKVEGRHDRARSLPVRFLRSADEAYEEVEKVARAGQAVLYLRNTVDDALDAYRELRHRGLTPHLFHARYALTDRLDIERKMLNLFGKSSEPAERREQVLVATQVVEQSLDLDFDAMVSDLAPIDLLIQRAGRLWRHQREERTGDPELLVVGPEPVADADETWFSHSFPRTAYVYRNHSRLWLTAKVLEDTGAIESPAGLRGLVEAVYGVDADADVPDGLLDAFFEAEGRSSGDRSLATANVLAFGKGYIRDSGAWHSDHRTPTRLADQEQVTLRLARVVDGHIVPYAREYSVNDQWRGWRLSEVNVAARLVGGEAVPQEYVKAAQAAKAEWSRYDSDKLLVILEPCESDDSGWLGFAQASASVPTMVSVRYHRICGIEISADGSAAQNVPATRAGYSRDEPGID